MKHMRWGLLAVMIFVFLAGCGNKSPDYSAEPDKNDGFMHSHPTGTTVRYDLNGDGVGEDITVNAQEYADGTLRIGEAERVISCVSPTGYFTVLNVDQDKDDLLIGISDYGFSDDPVTVLYAYDGKRITEVGYYEDITGKNEWGYASAVIHGDGTVTARKRWNVLGTWNTKAKYEVSKRGVADTTDFYPYVDWDGKVSAWEVTTKVPVILNEENGTYETRTIVPAGTRLAMTGMKKGSDAYSYWVCFDIKSTGETLWMIVEEVDWVTYVPAEYDIVTSEDAFDGFYYAG